MRRTGFGLLLFACAALYACSDEVVIGDTRDSEQVREDRELELIAQKLTGAWLGTDEPVKSVKLTVTPGREERSGNFVVTCVDPVDQCRLADFLKGLTEADLSPAIQVMFPYALLNLSWDEQARLLLMAGDQVVSLRVAFSSDYQEVMISAPLLTVKFKRLAAELGAPTTTTARARDR